MIRALKEIPVRLKAMHDTLKAIQSLLMVIAEILNENMGDDEDNGRHLPVEDTSPHAYKWKEGHTCTVEKHKKEKGERDKAWKEKGEKT